MTATLPARVPAGDPGGHGGRFATAECPGTYRRLVAATTVPLPELGVPARVEKLAGGAAVVGYDTAGQHYDVPAPRCPHGHFARWAARNCKPCNRPTR